MNPRGVYGRPSPEYTAWTSAKGRCFNPRNGKYAVYGGRGITMCDRWRDDFLAFLNDMGPKPSPQHSIDRIDNDGNYEPLNCRWALSSVQRRNSQRVIRTAEGSLADTATLHGVHYSSLHRLVRYCGYTPHDAVEHLRGYWL